MWLNFVVWGGGNYTKSQKGNNRTARRRRARKNWVFLTKIRNFLLENSSILLKTYACGADRRRRREKLRISSCKTTKNLLFKGEKN